MGRETSPTLLKEPIMPEPLLFFGIPIGTFAYAAYPIYYNFEPREELKSVLLPGNLVILLGYALSYANEDGEIYRSKKVDMIKFFELLAKIQPGVSA
jgi:hypothetical protein